MQRKLRFLCLLITRDIYLMDANCTKFLYCKMLNLKRVNVMLDEYGIGFYRFSTSIYKVVTST